LKTAGYDETKPCDLADNGRKPLLTKRLFDERQDLPITTGLDIDHAVGVKARRREARRKKVASRQAPYNRPFQASCNSGREECRRPRELSRRAGLYDLMQGAERKAAARQVAIDRIDGERQRRAASLVTLNALNSLPQIGNGYLLPGTHAPCSLFSAMC